jgi:hypothetical protein
MIVHSYTNTDYRDWWETKASIQNYQIQSNWTALTEGEHYYMEAWHLEGSGTDHFAAAVEIEQSAITGHHHAMKEI